MTGKILIVEDNNEINDLICVALTKASYVCTQAYSGTEALLYIEQKEYALIILDLMLPGMNGDVLIKKIKPQNNTPVIIVSAKDELDCKIDLLTLGADDYITKPFEIKELEARVTVQIRRNNKELTEKSLKYKEQEINKNTYEVTIKNQNISVTKQEFKILELLLKYPNKVFSKQDIYDYAWDDYYIGEDKTINVHISNIRQKLKHVTDEEYIETVWGVGFKLTK